MKEHTCLECGQGFTGRKKKYCSKECSDEVRRRKNRERYRQDNPDWDREVSKVCEQCRCNYSVPKRTAHQARFCSDECRGLWYSREVRGNKPLEEHNLARRKRKILRQKRLEKEKAIKTIKRSVQSVIKIKEEEQRIKELTRECVECSDVFYNPSPNVLTCSTECSCKRSRRISREIYKGRINKSNLVDKNINLTKLYKRDEGVCYLCDERCDWNDKVVTVKGHTIVGEKYPSIEHVVPLSKGGMHSWENVKLACMRCNTLKGDKIKSVENKVLNA